MRDRESLRLALLARAGWPEAARAPLAGDASMRRYERVSRAGRTAILMDVPPGEAAEETIRSFIAIADLLRSHGYSAPEIHASDDGAGLVLLEDFGDDSFARLLALDRRADLEETLYAAATDFLIDLHGRDMPESLPRYDADWLLRDAHLFLEAGAPALEPGARGAFDAAWRGPLDAVARGPVALSLRDFHVGNLMWLPGRAGGANDPAGIGRVGLLDFQDARMAPLAYDLVSLLQDARRDVAPALEERMVERYLARRPALDRAAFAMAYAVLGAQRAMRVIGIFARLAARDGKPAYLAHLPRVWRHLARDLSHPSLAPVAAWLDRWVPAERRARLPRAS